MAQVLGVVGSMRKGGQTDILVRAVLGEMTKADPELETAILYTADRTYAPCQVTCHAYCAVHPFHCSIDDDAPYTLSRMCAADAIVIGAPLYFRAPPSGFHTMVERIQSMAFFHETVGGAAAESPLAGVPCGLVAAAEYSNPHSILEYLHDFATLMHMRPVLLDAFPYLGVGAHGKLDTDEVFRPHERCRQLAHGLIDVLHDRKGSPRCHEEESPGVR